MTTKNDSGGSKRPPPVARPAAPAPPPQRKRPQLRPVGSAKPPAIRPLARPPAPKPPARVESLPTVTSDETEEDATNVMTRPPVTPPSAALLGGTLRSPTESQRTGPNQPPAQPPASSDDDAPETDRAPSEHTMVMPNAPVRQNVSIRSKALPTKPSEKPIQLARVATLPLPKVDPPPSTPIRDETAAMVRENWTPSAPPIALGPVAHPPPQGPLPPNVAVGPASVRPPPAQVVPVPSQPPLFTAPSAETPGALGFVLFAAPLALAMAAIAGLALL